MSFRISIQWTENCKAHGELGQALNAFSIEYEPLQDPLDTLGQKFDNSGYELQALVDSQEVLVETVEIGVGLCKAAKVSSRLSTCIY
jgi:hypothetical protein